MDLPISYRIPGWPGVGRLPQASATRAKIIFVRPFEHARRSNRTTATIGPDVAPTQRTEETRIIATLIHLAVDGGDRAVFCRRVLLGQRDAAARQSQSSDGNLDDSAKRKTETYAHGETSLGRFD